MPKNNRIVEIIGAIDIKLVDYAKNLLTRQKYIL
jgi:hypothetical protein